MLHILDYKLKVRMPVEDKDSLHTSAVSFMCMFGSKAEDLTILDDETGDESPFVVFIK